MENNMQIFQNEKFGKIRTLNLDGEPWFVAADVCKALLIVNSRDALTHSLLKRLRQYSRHLTVFAPRK